MYHFAGNAPCKRARERRGADGMYLRFVSTLAHSPWYSLTVSSQEARGSMLFARQKFSRRLSSPYIAG